MELGTDRIVANLILKKLIENIVEELIYGVTNSDPYGRKVRIFIDVVVYLGDYNTFRQ